MTPVTPTATPAESDWTSRSCSNWKVTFTEGDEVHQLTRIQLPFLMKMVQPAASVEAKSPAGDVIGTFTVDKETGVVTFTQQINLIQVMLSQLRFKS